MGLKLLFALILTAAPFVLSYAAKHRDKNKSLWTSLIEAIIQLKDYACIIISHALNYSKDIRRQQQKQLKNDLQNNIEKNSDENDGECIIKNIHESDSSDT